MSLEFRRYKNDYLCTFVYICVHSKNTKKQQYLNVCNLKLISSFLITSYIGFKYGNTLVPMSEDDKKNMKYKCEKGLKILGFTNTNNVSKLSFCLIFALV